MSKLIKNNDFIRNKIEECIELRLDEINDLFEVSLNEDYLSIDFIKQPCLEKAVRVIYFRFFKNHLYFL